MKRKTSISDAAVARRTGKTWEEWFTLLDAQRGQALRHQQIVALVAAEMGRIPWWQQMVTVAYEQARGLRQPHQKPSGYEVSRSRTINAPAAALYRAFADASQRHKWLGKTRLTVRVATPGKKLRANWSNTGTIIEARLTPTRSGKTRVTVQHMKPPDAKSAARSKSFWEARLARLARLFEK
jgi:uncharacterized protein YndB with AHSA1/START domain